jgi:hypothetical protein
MTIIHTLPLLIRDGAHREHDIAMLVTGLSSLCASAERQLVVYNQGCLNNGELRSLLAALGLPDAAVLGNGDNAGIAPARQACFEYIWRTHPDVSYISEIHVDMLFPPNWYDPLIAYIEQTGEPMAAPGIVTAFGELQPVGEFRPVPTQVEAMVELLVSLARDEAMEGFVHPCVHRASALREVGGYDTALLRGKQGYEDDSLLLGYLYYMGTRTNWRPKCCLRSWVYHATMAQRMAMTDKAEQFRMNEEGLFRQYGVYGLRHLAKLHRNPQSFEPLIRKYMALGGHEP